MNVPMVQSTKNSDDRDCWDYKTTEPLDWSVETEPGSTSPLFTQEWNKTEMYLAPGSYCTYRTTHDTKVEFDSLKVDVSYYEYEGNNLPKIGKCKLQENESKKQLTIADNFLKTGLLNGLLSGNCGFFVVLHNKNL